MFDSLVKLRSAKVRPSVNWEGKKISKKAAELIQVERRLIDDRQRNMSFNRRSENGEDVFECTETLTSRSRTVGFRFLPDQRNNPCPCEFSTMYKLPCRHVLLVRMCLFVFF